MLSQEYLPLLLLLFITSVLHVVTTTVYYVVPDSNFLLNNYTNTLQHYVINRRELFKFNTDVELRFLTGTHFINETFIIDKELNLNLTLSGRNSVIVCGNRQVGISIISVISFTMKI